MRATYWPAESVAAADRPAPRRSAGALPVRTYASATAAFAYGLLKAVRKGYLGEEYAEAGWRAYAAVLGRIDADGVVQGVSYGTGMGRTLQYYRDIPICPMPYGQSMALLLLVESLRHSIPSSNEGALQ